MSHQPSTIRRIWLTIAPCGTPGRIGLRLSPMPPAETADCMAVLMTRGDVPVGWPLELEVVSDPSADPALKGKQGDPGLTAYQVARAEGYGGTQSQWLASLVGTTGASAYQLARAAGYGGTQSQWLASLKGADATDGQVASAVATYLVAHPVTTLVGTATMTVNATVAIAVGIHEYVVPLTGLAVGDALLLTPAAALPAGWAIHGAVVTTAGSMRVTVTTPLLAIGASISIGLKVRRFNI